MGSERTKTSSIIRENILQILNDGASRNIDEIKYELANKGLILNQDYNINHLSGALNRLKSQGSIRCIDRGVYQKELNVGTSFCVPNVLKNFEFRRMRVFSKLRNKVNDDLRKEIQMITAEVNNIDISDMDQDDWKDLNYILNIKKFLEKQLGE